MTGIIKVDDLKDAGGNSIISSNGSGTFTYTFNAGSIAGAAIANDAIDSAHYADGSIDLAHMSVNSIDSDQYVDGSIDLAHMSVNSIDSDQYVDGSIDLAHMSSQSVDEDNLHISNSPTNGYALTAQSGNAGGLTWADISTSTATIKAAFPGIDDTSSSFDDCVTITDNEVVINEDGDNQDFRVESDDQANFFFCDASANIAGFSKHDRPDMGFIHITSASSGVSSVHANADELVLENNGACGLSILSSTSTNGAIIFGDSGGNARGRLTYEHGTDDFAIDTAGTERLRIQDTGQLATGGETAADVSLGGLCLNQSSYDTSILTFKSSDVAHSVTGQAEADTFGLLYKRHATSGGAGFKGLSEDTTPGVEITGIFGSTFAQTGKNSGSDGCVNIRGAMRSGSGAVTLDEGGNLMNIKALDTNRFIFDVGGTFHADASSTTFDAYDDAQLARAYDLSHGRGVIKSKFDKFISYNAEKLADLKLLGRDEDGTPSTMVNITGMQQLHNGAIWQQYEKHERLLEAVYDLAKEAVGVEKANAILDKHEVKRLN